MRPLIDIETMKKIIRHVFSIRGLPPSNMCPSNCGTVFEIGISHDAHLIDPTSKLRELFGGVPRVGHG